MHSNDGGSRIPEVIDLSLGAPGFAPTRQQSATI